MLRVTPLERAIPKGPSTQIQGIYPNPSPIPRIETVRTPYLGSLDPLGISGPGDFQGVESEARVSSWGRQVLCRAVGSRVPVIDFGAGDFEFTWRLIGVPRNPGSL